MRFSRSSPRQSSWDLAKQKVREQIFSPPDLPSSARPRALNYSGEEKGPHSLLLSEMQVTLGSQLVFRTRLITGFMHTYLRFGGEKFGVLTRVAGLFSGRGTI